MPIPMPMPVMVYEGRMMGYDVERDNLLVIPRGDDQRRKPKVCVYLAGKQETDVLELTKLIFIFIFKRYVDAKAGYKLYRSHKYCKPLGFY